MSWSILAASACASAGVVRFALPGGARAYRLSVARGIRSKLRTGDRSRGSDQKTIWRRCSRSIVTELTSDWMRRQSALRKFFVAGRIQKLLKDELKTEIRARLPLDSAVEGLREYEREMTGGKIIFVPGASAADVEA